METMYNKRLHTPDGVRDYLPNEFAVKHDIENRIGEVFLRYGYLPVSSPTFEHVEVFNSALADSMYKFLDRDGSVLALRPDITPSIARIAATSLNKDDMPFRFCYFENTFRYNENYRGKQKEFTQAGVELIGVNSSYADAECVAVACNSLLSAGLTDFKICISDARFLDGLLNESGILGDKRRQILQYILDGDFAEMKAALKNLPKTSRVPENIFTLLSKLPFLTGGEKTLQEARALIEQGYYCCSPSLLAALDDLEKLYGILDDYGLTEHVMLDLSIAGRLDYYTGLILRGYAAGSGTAVIDGGRYDNLSAKYEADFPAVGFAIQCNRLIDAVLSAKSPSISAHRPDTLASFSEKGRKTAQRTADELRRSGLYIETSLCGHDVNDSLAYAKKKGFGGMLYFSDDNSVTVYDLVNDIVKDVKIDELLNTL